MSVDAILRRHGIELRSVHDGNQKARCPKCSHQRKNKRDPCLSVLIRGDTVKFNCFNCGWAGADGGAHAERHVGKSLTRSSRRPSEAWKAKFRTAWW